MRASWLVVVAITFAVACARTPPDPWQVPERYAGPIRSDDVDSGRQVFRETCKPCHVLGYAPDLYGIAATPGQIRTQVRQGLGAMPGFTAYELPPTDLEALLAYLEGSGTVRPVP